MCGYSVGESVKLAMKQCPSISAIRKPIYICPKCGYDFNKKQFHKLMKHTKKDIVVLFYDNKYGCVVKSKDILFKIGYCAKSYWNVDDFQDYNKPVTITL